MAITNAKLVKTQLDMLEVPVGKSYAITNIMVCNTDSEGNGNDAIFNMYLIPNGAAKGDETMVIYDLVLPTGETFTFDSEKIVLDQGDKLSFEADETGVIAPNATSLTAVVSYLEV